MIQVFNRSAYVFFFFAAAFFFFFLGFLLKLAAEVERGREQLHPEGVVCALAASMPPRAGVCALAAGLLGRGLCVS